MKQRNSCASPISFHTAQTNRMSKLDNNISLNDSFSYNIARMQWNYGYPDPLKDRVNEFLDKVCDGL